MTDSSATLHWKFSQVFGERAPSEDLQEDDIITAIGFEKRGDYLALGDRGGRIIIFERDDKKNASNQQHARKDLEQTYFAPAQHPQFRYKTEFHSHEPEFDYLKSVEIEERINKLRWCITHRGSLFILSTNDKTIKLWKVKEHKVKQVKEMVPLPSVCSENALLAESSFMSEQENPHAANGYHLEWIKPLAQNLSQDIACKIAGMQDTVRTKCQKVYAHAHSFNINSISNNSDGETFISADDLRINLWNLDVNDQGFNIIDMKPSNMEDLTEVITSAEFHPLHCNLLAYSSSRGFIRLSDLRQAARCDDHGTRIFRHGDSHGLKSFFTEIITSISDIKFLNDGQHIISRDYMTMKLWDMRMDSSPVAIFKIHEHLRPKLAELYNNDRIFDKFECCFSGDGLHFATGSYGNLLRTFSPGTGTEETFRLEVSRNSDRKHLHQAAPKVRRSSLSNLTRGFYRHDNSSSNDFSCNLDSKLLHVAWHPTSNLVACAAESTASDKGLDIAFCIRDCPLFLSSSGIMIGTAEIDVVDLSSDDEVIPKEVKLESDVVGTSELQNETDKFRVANQYSEENRSSNVQSTGSSVLEQGMSPVDDTGLSSASPIGAAPICRQFWKAGQYDDGIGSTVAVQNAKNYLHVHPLFLHSNATSHKWAFGAIAELLDNAIDEAHNGKGATFVIVDKTLNPKDGSPALLIQDDGGGMDPETMRRCMSFGFSDKKSKSAIGQYGNGFKTSTMRLGADVIVFSRRMNNRILTQSIGLLSYSFLMQTLLDRIVVPMVNYEFNTSTRSLDFLHGKAHFMSNLSKLLQWSPYSSEAELLKQFDDIGSHGTKVIVYNLWLNDDGNLELDFDTDPEDILIAGDRKKIDAHPAWKTLNEQHISNRFHYSLRVYSSILYLKMPENFRIILRGQIVTPHNIVDDLKHFDFIYYKPHADGSVQGQVVTTIGFLKEAPHVNIHGFNVYHKNRLILPFWQVVSHLDSRGRGVVGVLQADFVQPTHNKQDFERTSLFQKLEVRLKEMTWEYWDTHCTLIGYKEKKKLQPKVTTLDSSLCKPVCIEKPVASNKISLPVVKTKEAQGKLEQLTPKSHSRSEQGLHAKRKVNELKDLQKAKKQIVTIPSKDVIDQESINLMQEYNKLHAKCLEFQKNEEELNLKVTQLRSEIQKAQDEYSRLLAELQSLDTVKVEK
ncbi:hypothetical protein L6164_014737 [Bauhinia variegata]|uniref:Uncharacterized protein n=1 Tax=Bauhinia variegata TaxID=167791 RepID=A0ACB9NII0_BAUVA|nr:hypothetical protein L6164_014737 [Bauhinia variegata]